MVSKIFFWLNETLRKNKFRILIVVVAMFLISTAYTGFSNINIYINPLEGFSKKSSILGPELKFPEKVNKNGNQLIEKFFKHIDSDEIGEALKMISEENKTSAFTSVEEVIGYLRVVYKDKKRDIRPYSSDKGAYIYQVKVFEDILATGITKEEFTYLDTKLVITEEDGKFKLGIKGYIKKENIDGLFEDNRSKFKLLSRKTWFEKEEYILEVTNRSEDTLVILDESTIKGLGATLEVGTDSRKAQINGSIYIRPYETSKIKITFPKLFAIDKEASKLRFDNLRFIKDYKPVARPDSKLEAENNKNLKEVFQVQITIEENK